MTHARQIVSQTQNARMLPALLMQMRELLIRQLFYESKKDEQRYVEVDNGGLKVGVKINIMAFSCFGFPGVSSIIVQFHAHHHCAGS